jgi:hypothetical protein
VLSACTEEREQSTSFQDEHLEQQVVQKMENGGISFRREGRTIWYSIDDREAVKRIFEEEVARRPIHYKFYDKEKQSQFLSLLGEQGIIASSESNSEPPYVVYVPNEYRDESEESFQRVLRGN